MSEILHKIWNGIKEIFPGGMFIAFSLCILVKIAFFLYGVYMYNQYLLNGTSVTIDNVFIQWLNVSWWNAEGLSDFAGDYILFRNNFLNGAILYSAAFNGRYLYPPVYYYLISVLAYWTIYAGPITMLATNIMTGYLLFHLVKKMGASNKAAIVMMVLQLLCPINLYYNDFIWQNAGVFTMFVIWSMLMITREKYSWAMVILGIAASVKQVAFFFLPVFLFGIIYKKYFQPKKEKLSKYTIIQYLKSIPLDALVFYGLLPVLTFLVLSLPYIYSNPIQYLDVVMGNLGFSVSGIVQQFSTIIPITVNGTVIGYFPNLSAVNPGNNYQFNYRAPLDVAVAWILYIFGVNSEVGVIFALIFQLNLLLYGSTILIFILYWQIVKNQRGGSDQEFYWLLWFAGCLSFFGCLLFVNVGIYKYYFISMTPFWAIYGNFGSLQYQSWRHIKGWRNQFFGGGSALHIAEVWGIQLILIVSDKWLAPLFLYLPLFIINLVHLIERSRVSTLDEVLKEDKTTAIPREEPKLEETQNLTDWVSREKEEEAEVRRNSKSY